MSTNELEIANLLGEALDDGPALVFVADEEMRYLAVNKRACEVLGYTREELLALRVTDVAPGPAAPHLWQKMLRDGRAVGSTAIRRKDGTTARFYYWASQAEVDGETRWVSIGVLADELPPLTL